MTTIAQPDVVCRVIGGVDKRTAEGLSKREIMRCLKRYVAREFYPLICDITAAQELESAA